MKKINLNFYQYILLYFMFTVFCFSEENVNLEKKQETYLHFNFQGFGFQRDEAVLG